MVPVDGTVDDGTRQDKTTQHAHGLRILISGHDDGDDLVGACTENTLRFALAFSHNMNTNYRNGKCFKNMVMTDEGYFYLKYDMNFHADRILHKELHC